MSTWFSNSAQVATSFFLRGFPGGGGATSVCLASTCLCARVLRAVLCSMWSATPGVPCASPDLWSRAAERLPVAAARLLSLCTQESTKAGRRSDTGKFLGWASRQTNKGENSSFGLQWWFLLHGLLLRSLLSRFDAYRQRGHGGDCLSFFLLTLLRLNQRVPHRGGQTLQAAPVLAVDVHHFLHGVDSIGIGSLM